MKHKDTQMELLTHWLEIKKKTKQKDKNAVTVLYCQNNAQVDDFITKNALIHSNQV